MGSDVGVCVGANEGSVVVGASVVGYSVGADDGKGVGGSVGVRVGEEVGGSVGTCVGGVGAEVRGMQGAAVNFAVGERVPDKANPLR